MSQLSGTLTWGTYNELWNPQVSAGGHCSVSIVEVLSRIKEHYQTGCWMVYEWAGKDGEGFTGLHYLKTGGYWVVFTSANYGGSKNITKYFERAAKLRNSQIVLNLLCKYEETIPGGIEHYMEIDHGWELKCRGSERGYQSVKHDGFRYGLDNWGVYIKRLTNWTTQYCKCDTYRPCNYGSTIIGLRADLVLNEAEWWNT